MIYMNNEFNELDELLRVAISAIRIILAIRSIRLNSLLREYDVCLSECSKFP